MLKIRSPAARKFTTPSEKPLICIYFRVIFSIYFGQKIAFFAKFVFQIAN